MNYVSIEVLIRLWVRFGVETLWKWYKLCKQKWKHKFPNCKTNQVLTTEKDDFYVQYCCNQCVTFLDLCDAGKSGRTGIFDGLLWKDI